MPEWGNDSLTTVALAILKDTPWRGDDLRCAAQAAAEQVRALECAADCGRAKVFLAVVNAYRVRDQRRQPNDAPCG
jgi:hypothetical protein